MSRRRRNDFWWARKSGSCWPCAAWISLALFFASLLIAVLVSDAQLHKTLGYGIFSSSAASQPNAGESHTGGEQPPPPPKPQQRQQRQEPLLEQQIAVPDSRGLNMTDLVLIHIGKCGGTKVFQWLQYNKRLYHEVHEVPGLVRAVFEERLYVVSPLIVWLRDPIYRFRSAFDWLRAVIDFPNCNATAHCEIPYAPYYMSVIKQTGHAFPEHRWYEKLMLYFRDANQLAESLPQHLTLTSQTWVVYSYSSRDCQKLCVNDADQP
eukprot:TRINITY_DN14660_c0_g1_i1.p1 TRINITY_DN14660_c0_g1~~TRINITY_DN14660_c0_g1_i1.p1  ORF type:complete len:264 (-),score=12.00 TRINITY_DN14660_c0_g1_i1:381-1172(-)